MWFVKLTKHLFGWDWISVNTGYGDWKLRRLRKMWDGEWIYYRSFGEIKKAPDHDYITGLWLTREPEKKNER